MDVRGPSLGRKAKALTQSAPSGPSFATEDVASPKLTETGEEGYLLLAMVVMVALVLIALAVAAPVVAKDLRRDKEVESEHRAEQYVRAIRLYYRKFNSYPPSMEALEKSNNIRFLRHQYVDPLTGKPDWRIIHVGENQTTVKGFFGEPLGGLDTKGVGGGLGSAAGMASNNGGVGAAPTAGTSGTPGGTSTVGPTSGLAAGFSGATVGTPGTGGTAGAAGTSGSTGSSSSPFGSGGVGQIMGVGSVRSGASILTPNQQETYDTWEFLYDPRIELLYAKANILGGGVSSTPASSFGSDATSGKPNSGGTSPFGNPPGTPPPTGTGAPSTSPR